MDPPSAQKPGPGSVPPRQGAHLAEAGTGHAAGTTLRPPGPELWQEHIPDPLAPVRAAAETPVGRHTGPPAHQATLEHRVALASEQLDTDAERRANVALARWLAARGSELDRAIRLARRSLVLGEDLELRSELTSWFCTLGQYALAAFTLLPLAEQQPRERGATTLTEAARLLCRAGRLDDATVELERAVELDPGSAEPLELIGALGAVEPGLVSAQRAAQAYLGAALVRQSRRDRVGAFEALLRACESDPSDPVAAERLAAALLWRGRAGAADEVLREHGVSSGARAPDVHRRRMREALQRGDIATAWVASLDARSDASIDPEGLARALGEEAERGLPAAGLGFDELLERVQLLELLAARCLVALGTVEPTSARVLRPLLARFYEGPLGQPRWAARLWVEVLADCPDNEEPFEQVVRYATGNESVLLDAFEWTARSAHAAAAERARRIARTLLEVGERKAASGLVVWALDQLGVAAESAERAAGLRQRFGQAAALEDQTLRERIAHALGSESVADLDQCARDSEFCPSRLDDRFKVVDLLAQRTGDGRWFSEAENILWRQGRFEELESWIESRMKDAPRAVGPALVLALARTALRRGQLHKALDVLRSGLSGEVVGADTAALAATLAARFGDDMARARALERLASRLAGPLKAGTLAIVADAYRAAGDRVTAWSVAQAACRADPASARAIAARADAAKGRDGPEAVEALERAVEVIVPRVSTCAELTRLYEALGELTLAAVWSRRWLDLRPADPTPLEAFVTCAGRIDSADRLVEATERVLVHLGSASSLAEPLRLILGRLADADVERACAIAWRILELFGPGPEPLRQAVLEVAERANNPGLALALKERWVASGSRRSPDQILEIAQSRRRAGDPDGAVGALLRALQSGASAEGVLAELEDLRCRSSDGELLVLEVRATALAKLRAGPSKVAQAWRELGAARWDLARDPEGALQAWEHAREADPDLGVERFACDVAAFAGHATALEHLARLEARIEEPRELARVLTAEAVVAFQGGIHKKGLEASALALELDPGRADVLAVAERCARSAHDFQVLEEIYGRLVAQAAGRRGERAVHYRAARFFERCGQHRRAIEHAVGAFDAAPEEGAVLALLLRLARVVDDPGPAAQALARQARAAGDSECRERWLRHASRLAAREPEKGSIRSLELLAEAVLLKPEGAGLDEILRAIVEYRRSEPAGPQREALGSVLLDPLRRIGAEGGAKLAVQAAELAVEQLADSAVALEAARIAIEHDPGLDEYRALQVHAPRLLSSREEARSLVHDVAAVTERAPRAASESLVALAGILARGLGDPDTLTRFTAAVARRGPDDPELEKLLEQADARLLGELLRFEPLAGDPEVAFRVARRAMAGDFALTAADALEQVVKLPAISATERIRAVDDLQEIYAQLGHRDQLEKLLSREIERHDLAPERKARLALDLAALVAVRGAPQRAVRLLMDTFAEEPVPPEVLEDALTFAHQAQDSDAIKWALTELVRVLDAPTRRVEVVRELAQHLDARGESALALTYWSELVEMAPDDPAVTARLRLPEALPPWSRRPALGAEEPFGLPHSSKRGSASSVRRSSLMWSDAGEPVASESPLIAAVAAFSDAVVEAGGAAQPVGVDRDDAPSSAGIRDQNEAELELQAALTAGDVEAGGRLIELYSNRADRSADLVGVCRKLALLRPADPWPLAQLAAAAQADRNRGYARAVEHVLGALGFSEQRVDPPPLSHQPEQPDLVHALLFRQPTPANEALGLVWEGAERLLRQELSEHGITGVERVNLGAPTALAMAYYDAARALGLLRVPLFQRRSPEPFTLRVALLSPPAIIASGELLEDKAALDFAVGSALAAAMPMNALLFGFPEAKARELLEGLLLAFGPPRRVPAPSEGATAVAEMLWSAIPPRDQRRLRQLCEDPDQLSYEDALRSARRAARRAGLFVSGDLGASLQRMAGEQEGGGPPDTRELVRICSGTAGGRDLFTVAIGPEYAEMRWQRRPSNMPAADAWGTLRSRD